MGIADLFVLALDLLAADLGFRTALDLPTAPQSSGGWDVLLSIPVARAVFLIPEFHCFTARLFICGLHLRDVMSVTDND